MTSTAPTLAAANRDLLMHLAHTPDPDDDTDWTREHNQRVNRIHTFIEGAQARRETAVVLPPVLRSL